MTPFLVATLRVFLAGLWEDTADLAAILDGVVTVVGALDSSESLSRVVLVVWLLSVLQLLPKSTPVAIKCSHCLRSTPIVLKYLSRMKCEYSP